MTHNVDSPPALKLLESGQPLIIGHRGFARSAPENTIPSFKLAIEAGVEVVELDCRETHDKQLVVFHDLRLNRTTNARQHWRRKRVRIQSQTAAELQGLDAGSWFNSKFANTKIPLLSEALDFIHGAGCVTLIERKSGEAAIYATLLRAKELINRVVLISFDWHFLRQFHELEPQQVLGALGRPAKLASGRRPGLKLHGLNARWLDLLAHTGARLVVWNKYVSKRSVKLAHERGLKVWIYTVDDPRLARKLVRMGVDGIITNNPTRIREALGLS